MPPRALFFLHIQKSAGTFLRYHLKDGFRSHEILPALVPADLTPEVLAKKQSARFITGHFSSTFVDDIVPRPLTVTVLREPIAREISQYAMFSRDHEKFLLTDPFGIWGQYWRAMQDTGPGILRTDLHLRYFDNMQCRLLAGGPWWDTREGARTSRETLDLAKTNLQQMGAFGLMEKMKRSVQLIEHALGWPQRPLRRRVNVRPEGGEDPRVAAFAQDTDTIRAANALDLELYAFAQPLFEKRYAAFLASGLNDSERHPETISSAEDYPAGDGLLPQGFSPSFRYKPVDRDMRWLLMREQGRLHLPIARGRRCAIEMDITWPANAVAVNSITANVEGKPIAFDVERMGGTPPVWRLRAVVTPENTKVGLVAMDILTPSDMRVRGKRNAFCLLNVRLQPEV